MLGIPVFLPWSELQRISEFTESVASKLKKHYSKIFPKRCNSCGTIYHNREEFWNATMGLRTHDTVFDEIGLQEYRNCPCGSTLIVWTQDRRDNSEYGQLRRNLFDNCFEKLQSISEDSDDEIRIVNQATRIRLVDLIKGNKVVKGTGLKKGSKPDSE